MFELPLALGHILPSVLLQKGRPPALVVDHFLRCGIISRSGTPNSAGAPRLSITQEIAQFCRCCVKFYGLEERSMNL